MDSIIKANSVDIIGPEWAFFNNPAPLNKFGAEKLVEYTHKSGFLIHPFTAKDDLLRFSSESAIEEYEFYFK